jgi:hypothetical protein
VGVTKNRFEEGSVLKVSSDGDATSGAALLGRWPWRAVFALSLFLVVVLVVAPNLMAQESVREDESGPAVPGSVLQSVEMPLPVYEGVKFHDGGTISAAGPETGPSRRAYPGGFEDGELAILRRIPSPARFVEGLSMDLRAPSSAEEQESSSTEGAE